MMDDADKINSIKNLKNLIKAQKIILDNLQVLQFTVNKNGIIFDCNRIALKNLDYKIKKELIGKPFLAAVFTDSSLEKAEKMFLKLRQTGILKNEKVQVKTSKEKPVEILLNANLLNEKKDKYIFFLTVQEKIDNYKKIETGISNISGFPFDNPNPIFRVNKKLRIMYANESAKSILNRIGIKDAKIPEKFLEQIMPLIKRKDDNLMTLEFKIGTSFYKFSIVKIKDSGYYNIYGSDITDIKKEEKSDKNIYKKAILLNDRNYIARELHDTVTQTLFSANLIAEVLPRLWKRDPKGVIKRLDEVRMLNNIALTEMRALLFDLRPSSFKTEELSELLRELVKSISRKSRIPISVEMVKKYQYSHRVELSFYRIAQESLNNIAKHSCATKASLILKSLNDRITMDIEDNGIGFNPEVVAPNNLGLLIMKERVKMIGASLLLNSSSSGTKISVVYNNNKKNNHDRKKDN